MVNRSISTDGGESSYFDAPSPVSQPPSFVRSISPVRFSQDVQSDVVSDVLPGKISRFILFKFFYFM